MLSKSRMLKWVGSPEHFRTKHSLSRPCSIGSMSISNLPHCKLFHVQPRSLFPVSCGRMPSSCDGTITLQLMHGWLCLRLLLFQLFQKRLESLLLFSLIQRVRKFVKEF